MSLPTWMKPIAADDWLTGTIDASIIGNDADHLEAKLTWNSDQDTIRTSGEVFHGLGRRLIESQCKLSDLLDSLAATKAGRKALLEALLRHN